VLREVLHGLIAQTADAAATGASGPPAWMQFFPWVLFAFAAYFLLFRPQSQQAEKQKQFMSQLKKGDEVLLSNGIFGKIFEVRDAEATVEIAKEVRIRVLKSSLAATSVPVKVEEKKS
jgi:preprotein translocase subunit YajC